MPPISKSSKTLEYLFILIIFFSILSCLARTDFNILYGFMCYYLWALKENKITITIILMTTLFALILDLLWILIVGSIWSEAMSSSKIWSEMEGMYGFAKWISIVNCIFKIVIAVVAYLVRQDYNNSPADDHVYLTKEAQEKKYDYQYKQQF